MQFRVVRTNNDGKIRQYGQIVESYRRESDRMPTHRVLYGVGPVTDLEAENYRVVFAASRAGKKVAVVDPDALRDLMPDPVWNHSLANVAACWQAWRDCGLQSLLSGLMAGHEESAEPAGIVAALVIQRCVEPDSKLAACRWFPRTMLPELLGISPESFHNTRVHRVLERLEAIEEDLQNSFGNKLLHADGLPLSAMFVDCTDTWFTGEGPELAQLGKTKEKLYRKKIGIVLMCRQDGMPLRFKVIQGNTDDGVAMLRMFESLRAEPWLTGAPLVCDRALGNTADLLKMIEMDIKFVTALVANEHAAYGARIECPALVSLDHNAANCLEKAGQAVTLCGMERHSDDLYLLDMSVVQRDESARRAVAEALGSAESAGPRRGWDLARATLTEARKYRKMVEAKQVSSYGTLQRGLGRSNGHMFRILSLLKLPTEIQEQILQGAGRHLSRQAIARICQGRDSKAHCEKFAAECAAAREKRSAVDQPRQGPNDAGSPWVQLVVVFNPQIWKFKRETAAERIEEAEATLVQQNQHLINGLRTVRQACNIVQATLKRLKLNTFYTVNETKLAGKTPQLALVRDDDTWQSARKNDGFHVIASSPEVNLSAVERVRLYRSKDGIEKDFQDIKSVLELRPVRHRTDAKVRAHVTLCVLALALQRWQKQRLVKAGRTESVATALTELAEIKMIGLQLPKTKEVIAKATLAGHQLAELARALGVEWVLTGKALSDKLHSVR